jgi:hypothetical protein
VPRHVARLVTRLVAPLVVDYSASPRLVVDYSTARPGASARRVARHATRRRSSSTTPRRAISSSTTPPRVWVHRHVVRLVTRLVAARRRLLRVAQSRRRLLRAPRLRLAATLALLQPRRASRLLVLRQH